MKKSPLFFSMICSIAAGAPAQGQTLNYQLFEDLFDEPVTTSAIGSPQRQSEVPATMNIITAEDIRRSGAITIPQILSRVAGIDLYTWSNNSADIAIRGLNQGSSNRVMVLVNGRENYTDGVGSFLWQWIPVRLDEIRQIEIIKGPASALYGFNAASGVINIITYNPQHEKVNVQRLTVGTDGTQEVSAVKTTQWDKGGARVSAFSSMVPAGDFHPALNVDRVAGAPHSETRTANLDAQFQLGDFTYARIQSGAATGNLRGAYAVPYFAKYLVAMNTAEVTSETGIGDIKFFISNNNYNLSTLKYAAAESEMNNNITVAKLQDVFKLGASDTFRIGAEYRLNRLPTYPIRGAVMTSQNAAVSGMWLHNFNQDLTWLTAVRLDRFSLNRSGEAFPYSPFSAADFDRSFTGTSFNSALVHRLSQLDSVKLMAARGLQLPSLTELGGNQNFNLRSVPFTYVEVVASNPFLTPSSTMHYEASYERQFPTFETTARIAAYHEDVKSLRDFGDGKMLFNPMSLPVAIITFEETGGLRLNGLEIEGSGKFLKDWRWSANYAYEQVKNQNFTGDKKDFAETTPRHKINLSLGWSKGPWETDAFVRYVSSANLVAQTTANEFAMQKAGSVWGFSQRVAYQFTPQLRTELVVSSKLADNSLYTEKARALLSLVGSF